VALKPSPPAAGRRPRVGLLGGSFNPAHIGHLHISRLALDLLKLDEIWWLVSPQNPLKPEEGMASLADRLNSARAMARGRNLWVTDIEGEMGTRFTTETLKALKGRFPRHRFVWIMGADNLIDIWRWNDWTTIFETVPVAVFARPTYSFRALVSNVERIPGRRPGRHETSGLGFSAYPAEHRLSFQNPGRNPRQAKKRIWRVKVEKEKKGGQPYQGKKRCHRQWLNC